ncbi:MAG: hypothetical protein ACLP52_13050 [Streptosporangiaceae bacterium]
MSSERDLIIHVPTGRILDISIDDDRYQIRDLRGKCHFGANAILICKSNRNPLYLQERKGSLVAVHEHSECCPPRIISSGGMSDEHKWQTEYLVRGFGDNGIQVASEVLGKPARLSTGVIPDAIAYGIVTIGAEVQRSALAARSAVERQRKALAAGVHDIWFSDRPQLPKWALRVPTVGMNVNYAGGWNSAPRRSATVASGVHVIQAVKCQVGSIFPNCPVTKKNWCGKYHAWHGPQHGLTVDDITELAPAGELTPLRFLGRADSVLLVGRASLKLYEELTGYHVAPVFTPAVIPPAPVAEAFGPILCDRNFRGEPLELRYQTAAAPREALMLRDVPVLRKMPPGTLCAGGCGARPFGGAEYCQACRVIRKLRQIPATRKD